jgi:hypothetical protein
MYPTIKWKEHGGKRTWSNLTYFHGAFLEGLSRNTKILRQNNRCLNTISNQETSKYNKTVGVKLSFVFLFFKFFFYFLSNFFGTLWEETYVN